MNKRERILVVAVAVTAMFWVIGWYQTAEATDRDYDNGPDVDQYTDVDVGGDTVDIDVGGDTLNIGGNKSLGIGLANSLGDVDIAGCLGSVQFATPLFSKQKLIINWPCMTEFYLRSGMFENAAMAICNTEVRNEFASEAECRAAHPFELMAPPAAIAESSDEDEEAHTEIIVEQQAMIDKQQEQLETYNDRLARLETRRAATRTVTNQVGLTDQQRDELAKVFEK